MKQSDMRRLILHAYEACKEMADDARMQPHAEVVARAEGQAQAFLAVLDLMDGHTAMISGFMSDKKQGRD